MGVFSSKRNILYRFTIFYFALLFPVDIMGKETEKLGGDGEAGWRRRRSGETWKRRGGPMAACVCSALESSLPHQTQPHEFHVSRFPIFWLAFFLFLSLLIYLCQPGLKLSPAFLGLARNPEFSVCQARTPSSELQPRSFIYFYLGGGGGRAPATGNGGRWRTTCWLCSLLLPNPCRGLKFGSRHPCQLVHNHR